MKARLFSSLLLIAVTLAACGHQVTSTPLPAPQVTVLSPTATDTAAPSATPAPTLLPALTRPHYTMQVILDYARKSVSVEQTILYPNQTGQTLSELVLAVEPNLWPNCFMLGALGVDGTVISDYSLDGQKLEFALPAPLEAGAVATLQIKYGLVLPLLQQEHGVRPQIFGYSQLQMNLTDWYPFVVPFINSDWVLHDPGYYGEHLVYQAADYVVDVRFADPTVNPIIASSGAPSPSEDGTTYTLTAGRTFALSASTEYQVASQQAGDVTLSSYYFPLNDVPGKAALTASAQAVQVYSQRFGTPYPHKTLSIVMGDFNDGMEFSSLFFMSRGAYNLYDGTVHNLLTTVAVHETSHQWWFEQVADDQAEQPWLDESLAAYSEHIFYETLYPDSLSWWWSYWYPRVGGTDSLDWIDISIYDAGGFIPYTNTVYLRGAHFLDDLRVRIGDQAFFAFLKDYLTQENDQIATTQDFFRILNQHTSVDYSDLLQTYFSHPPNS